MPPASPDKGSSVSTAARTKLCARAHDLRTRLSSRRIDALGAAEVGRRIFTDAADHVRARWLSLELNGYCSPASAKLVHLLLRVPANERLALQVAGYRAQRGLTARADGASKEFRHFFIESLWDLTVARRTVRRSTTTAFVALGFTLHSAAATHPSEGRFTRDVFDRVVDGFAAALHLQLGTFAEADWK
jgi:hypothetical protein